jgi:hypothetical protein
MVSLCSISTLLILLADLKVNAGPTQKIEKNKVSLGHPDEGIADQFCKNHYRPQGKVAIASLYDIGRGVIECKFNDVNGTNMGVSAGTGGINGTYSGSTAGTTGTKLFSMAEICRYKFTQRYHNSGRMLNSIEWDGFGKTCTAIESKRVR